MHQDGVFVPQLFDPPQPKKKTVGRTAILPDDHWDQLETIAKFETLVNSVGGVDKSVSVNKVLARAVDFFLGVYKKNVGEIPPEANVAQRKALAELTIEKRIAEAERLKLEGVPDDVAIEEPSRTPSRK